MSQKDFELRLKKWEQQINKDFTRNFERTIDQRCKELEKAITVTNISVTDVTERTNKISSKLESAKDQTKEMQSSNNQTFQKLRDYIN